MRVHSNRLVYCKEIERDPTLKQPSIERRCRNRYELGDSAVSAVNRHLASMEESTSGATPLITNLFRYLFFVPGFGRLQHANIEDS